ncbi:MAG: hypothetical protein E5V54_11190 [Mesorhizobium sp.]|nr:MAG: hypothetical protein E5V54_11190 [Mesorhizobium sp.]
MCDLSTILTLGSTLLGAAGAVQSAQATASANNYNAKVQDMNARLSERRAKDAIDRGQLEEQKKRQQASQIEGQQRAAMAANGVDLTFGSPLDTLVDTATMGELDALTIRTNATREAYDYKVDAVNKRAGANMSRMAASSASTGGYLDALGTVLGGAGKAYGQYKQSTIGSI